MQGERNDAKGAAGYEKSNAVEVLSSTKEWNDSCDSDNEVDLRKFVRHASDACMKRDRRLSMAQEALEEECVLGDVDVEVIAQPREWASVENKDCDSDEEKGEKHALASFVAREKRLTLAAEALKRASILGDADVEVVTQTTEWSAGESDEENAHTDDMIIQRQASATFEARERRLSLTVEVLKEERPLGDAEVAVTAQKTEWNALHESDGETDSDTEAVSKAVERRVTELYEAREKRLVAGSASLKEMEIHGDHQVDIMPSTKEWAGQQNSDDDGDDWNQVQRHATDSFNARERRLSLSMDGVDRDKPLGDVEVEVVSQVKEWTGLRQDDSDDDGVLTESKVSKLVSDRFLAREVRLSMSVQAMATGAQLADVEVDLLPQSKEWSGLINAGSSEDSDDGEAEIEEVARRRAASSFEARERRLTVGSEALKVAQQMGDVDIGLVKQAKEWSGHIADSDEEGGEGQKAVLEERAERHSTERNVVRERRLTAGSDALKLCQVLGDADIAVVNQKKEWAALHVSDGESDSGDEQTVEEQVEKHASMSYLAREERLSLAAEVVRRETITGDSLVEVVPQKTEWRGVVEDSDEDVGQAGMTFTKRASESFIARETRLSATAEALEQRNPIGDHEVDVVTQAEWKGAQDTSDDDETTAASEKQASDMYQRREKRLTVAAVALKEGRQALDSEVQVVTQKTEWSVLQGVTDESDSEKDEATKAEKHARSSFEAREKRLSISGEALKIDKLIGDSEVTVVNTIREWRAPVSDSEDENGMCGFGPVTMGRRMSAGFVARERRMSVGSMILQDAKPMGDKDVVVMQQSKEWKGGVEDDSEDETTEEMGRRHSEARVVAREKRLSDGAVALTQISVSLTSES
eukprot:TRINITY_DN7971_c0_g1_i1.p1 TRINITY_DN7971_c0_g1~~TRINITY_DN7971_c0_g1_i1.p1  ORF type:complete len:888 (-),score=203.57 TRINITY_DN7971_c0_g1_i1:95-2707(-)